jgi:hypothetical protein
MKLKSITLFLIITLLLAACSSATVTPPAVTENPTLPPTQPNEPTQPSAPTEAAPSTAYPAPGNGAASPTSSAYPAPGDTGTGSSTIPTSGYEPQPGDEALKRDDVTLNMTTTQVIVEASSPAKAYVTLTGTMPDPCHSLRVVVTPADANKMISLEAYSMVDPNTACITKIEPFTAYIPLGNYSSGTYTVSVNGAKIGQFDTIFAPQPGDDKLAKGDATVDIKGSGLVASSTQAGAMLADLKGYMPDPCHQLRIVLSDPDAQNKINLEVYTVYASGGNCITVTQPFHVRFPLASYSNGHYSVYVNGELLGEFDV